MVGSAGCLPAIVTSLHQPRHVLCHRVSVGTLLPSRARKAGGENWCGPGRHVTTATLSSSTPHGTATTTTPHSGHLPGPWGCLSPAVTTATSPTAPFSCRVPMGQTLQALGHHGGHSPGRRGSRGERGGAGCCLSAWLPAQCSPASDCPFCLPAGQPRPHKTKRPVSAACGVAWRPARGTLRGHVAGWHPTRRASWGSAGSWGTPAAGRALP